MSNIAMLAGKASTLGGIAYAINEAGQVAGAAGGVVGYVGTFAFLYRNGQMQDLGNLGGHRSEAFGLNNAGQVTGFSETPDGVPHAFLYREGQMTNLGDYFRSPNCYPSCGSVGYGINDAGQVVGEAATATGQVHAFLYSQGQVTDLGALGGCCSTGLDLNNAGQVVGESNGHAFFYTNGQMTDLGTLGGSDSSGLGINNAGQVVGAASTSTDSGLHAFFYSNGQMIDLNALINPALGITLNEATAINDQGQIVANGGYNSRAYLLTPIPEPSTLALFAVALLGLGVWARRQRNMFS